MAEDPIQDEEVATVHWLKSLLTDDDNSTHNIFKYLVLFAVLMGVIYAGYALIVQVPFNLLEYGTGLGAVLVAAGSALGISRPKV